MIISEGCPILQHNSLGTLLYWHTHTHKYWFRFCWPRINWQLFFKFDRAEYAFVIFVLFLHTHSRIFWWYFFICKSLIFICLLTQHTYNFSLAGYSYAKFPIDVRLSHSRLVQHRWFMAQIDIHNYLALQNDYFTWRVIKSIPTCIPYNENNIWNSKRALTSYTCENHKCIIEYNWGVLCNIGYLLETHGKLKFLEISFVHKNIHFHCLIV